ncbi:hypothetical protein WMY93_030462 [Mugilogobius chulae]|uniref:WAP domain-containing protein n=1 Tax=Mugilogobius chulae TaxID=88201 RepID=A0AAW0MJK4_9GOBI
MNPNRARVHAPGDSHSGFGICPQECNSDNDCDGTSNAAPMAVDICVWNQSQIGVPKLGFCPSPHPMKCEECFNDRQCGRRQLCCLNNCNVQTCMKPFRGKCPDLPLATCEDECTEDCNCPKNLKCCYNKCERRKTCIEPGAVPNPGACPPPGPVFPFARVRMSAMETMSVARA